MQLKHFKGLCAGLIALGALSSCGGGTLGTASPSAINLDSDVITGTWSAGTPRTCTPANGTVSPDSVDITVATVGTGQAAMIDSATITFTPADTETAKLPAPATQQVVLSIPINLGASTTIPMRVVSQDLKQQSPLSDLVCNTTTPTILKYYATIAFTAHVINASPDQSVSINPARINIRFSDFLD